MRRPFCTTLSFHVGVTGHRRIDEDFVEAKVDEILTSIKAALESPTKYWDGFVGPAILRVVSCLADGTDQIVAQKGLDLGYTLEAIVPFPVDDDSDSVHAKDRTDGQASLDAFNDLYGKAEHVLQLNPNYPAGVAWNSAEAESARNRGYERAGFLMLDHCDVLIAVWDGKPCDRPGSTAQVVERAVKMQIPVLIIQPRPTNKPVIIRFMSQEPIADEHEIYSIIDKILKKPDTLNRGFFSFDLFCVQKERRDVFSRTYNSIWPLFYRWIAWVPPKPDPLSEESKSSMSTQSEKDLQAFYQDADSLAIFYANSFRSSFVLSCFLGAAAVTVATIGGCVPWSPQWAIGLGFLEMVFILFICFNFFGLKQRRWQQKLTHFRYLAEQLRHFIVLRKIGWVIPEVHATQHYSIGEGQSWVRWYLRNITRNIGLPATDFTDTTVLPTLKKEIAERWIDDQARFHERTRDRYHLLEKRLTGLTYVLFVLTFAALFSHILLELPVLSHQPHENYHISSVEKDMHSPSADEHHEKSSLLIVCSLLTILFPVWAMAVHALGHYAEAHRMTDRSEAMHKRLEVFSEQVKQCTSPTELDQIARETAYLMLQEVADWHIQYQMTSPGLG